MKSPANASANKAPLYDVDWINGHAIEVFFVSHEMARALGGSPGWYCWACYPGCLPDGDAFGPFPTSYRALKNAIERACATTVQPPA
jgi:hypothetical protein